MSYQTADGRWITGQDGSDYHGFMEWRDCVIQITEDGATEQSLYYLEGLREYALAHNALNEPIVPPSINVWISNNGVTSAVQADDISVSGDTFKIGGIEWDGSAWDFSNAGSGGGSSLPAVTSEDNGDVLTVVEGVWGKAAPSGGVFVVLLSIDDSTNPPTYLVDKTLTEIYSAYQANIPIIAMEDPYVSGNETIYTAYFDDDYPYFVNMRIVPNSSDSHVYFTQTMFGVTEEGVNGPVITTFNVSASFT